VLSIIPCFPMAAYQAWWTEYGSPNRFDRTCAAGGITCFLSRHLCSVSDRNQQKLRIRCTVPYNTVPTERHRLNLRHRYMASGMQVARRLISARTASSDQDNMVPFRRAPEVIEYSQMKRDILECRLTMNRNTSVTNG
jgi:hypothetical protein